MDLSVTAVSLLNYVARVVSIKQPRLDPSETLIELNFSDDQLDKQHTGKRMSYDEDQAP